jgi:ATP-dependent DNA ligase
LQTESFLDKLDVGGVSGEWWAEPKWNGDRLVLLHGRDRSWKFMNRQKAELKYVPSPEVLQELNEMNIRAGGLGEAQLDGELVHNHTKHIKHTIIIYDIYTAHGEPQREPLDERRQWLELFVSKDSASRVRLADRFLPMYSSFKAAFAWAVLWPELEGLVLKRSDGLIDFNPVKSPDVAWQMKVRRVSKSYQF